MTKDEIIEQFDALGRSASYHYADDSGKEFHAGADKEKEAMALYHAHPELEAEFRAKAFKFLWSLDITLRYEARAEYAAKQKEKNDV